MTLARRSGLSVGSSSSQRVALVMAAAGLLATSLAAGPDDKDKPAATTKSLVLFDGKTLDGWKKTDFFKAGDVKVEDGTIVLSAGNKMTGITSTRKDLPTTNYELTYEAMRLSGSDFFAAATFPVGKSYVTLVNGGWGGNVTGLSSLNGADASENATNQYVKYRDKTWYKFRVRVTDKVIRCWIDEKPVVNIEHQNVEVRTRVEVRANQPLGFATYDTAGAVRKIEVRTLTPEEKD